MKHLLLLSLALFALQSGIQGQTVGTLLNTEVAFNGYTLVDPMGTGNTHLINNCGEVINTWTSDFNSGGACYLLEDGSLARGCKVSGAFAGGGVGGLAAAEMAARIGHNVVLFEASDRLGGQFNLAQHVPGKAEFAETIAYFENALIRQGAEIRLQSPATSTELDSFDHVVVATGVTARQPVIDGIDHPKVASYAEILRRQRVAGETVAIIGGGGIGFDVAAFLLDGDDHHHQDPEAFAAYWGIDMAVNSDGGLQAAGLPAVMPRRQITMLQRKQDRFGRTLGLTTGWVHKAILQRNNVQQIAAVDYRHIDGDGIHITVAGAPRLIAADTIIVCAGQEPEGQLSAALKSAGKAYSVVGGARLAGELDAKRAIEEGSRAAMAI